MRVGVLGPDEGADLHHCITSLSSRHSTIERVAGLDQSVSLSVSSTALCNTDIDSATLPPTRDCEPLTSSAARTESTRSTVSAPPTTPSPLSTDTAGTSRELSLFFFFFPLVVTSLLPSLSAALGAGGVFCGTFSVLSSEDRVSAFRSSSLFSRLHGTWMM